MALWNFTIYDTSPYLTYSPFVDGPGGWRTWYTQSYYNTVHDQVGQGDSYHIASQINANVTFSFYGTGIALLGTANSTFNVTVDNVPRLSANSTPISLNNTPTVLYSDYNLAKGFHYCASNLQNLVLSSSSKPMISQVTLAAPPSDSNSSLVGLKQAIVSSLLSNNENPPSSFSYDNSDTSSLVYSGAWSVSNVSGVLNSTAFHATTESGASVSLSFNGSSAVIVKGMVSSESGLYSVSLDGSMSTFNGSSLWSVPDALLFFHAGLDPGETHQISITNTGAGTRLCLSSIIVFQYQPKISATPSPPTPSATGSASVHIGVIVGPVIGFLIIIIIAATYILYRRRHQPQSVIISTPKLVPFLRSRSSARESSAFSGVRPPSLANSEIYLPSPAESSGGSNSLTKGGPQNQPYHPVDQDGQLNTSLVRMARLNTALMDDHRSEPDALYTSPLSEASTSTISKSKPSFPRRRPLPVPPHDAVLQAPESFSEDIKGTENSFRRHVRRKTQDTAPPQYER